MIAGPQWYPIVGNLPLVKKLTRRFGSQHDAFRELSAQVGSPLIGLKLGGKLTVVACGHEAVSAVLSSDALLGRPDDFFIRMRTLGSRRGESSSLGCSPRSFNHPFLEPLVPYYSTFLGIYQDEIPVFVHKKQF